MSLDRPDAVTIHDAGTSVTLGACRRPHDDVLVLFDVRVEAQGLTAILGIETLGGDSLDDFFRGLDADFRGWSGDRTWTSWHGSLTVRARHLGRAVLLTWTLRAPDATDDELRDWETTVKTVVNPGEPLRQVSEMVAAFLAV